LEFDKDDADIIQFIASASNLRSHIFDIPIQSRFDVKSSAGNIIPAIATTNAIIAGMIVMEAFKILGDQLNTCRNISLFKKPSAGRLLVAQALEKQNPNCYVCSNKSLTVKINTSTTTLAHFVDKVLKDKLGFNAPSIMSQSNMLYESGEGMDDYEMAQMNKQLTKMLMEIKVVHNAILNVTDDSQDFKLQIAIIHSEEFPEEQTFEIVGNAESVTSKPIKPSPTITERKMEEPEDEVIVVEAPLVKPPLPKRKRQREEEEQKAKKLKSNGSNNIVELD